MRPPKRQPLDLSPGAILHVQGFASGGFEAKNKFLIVIGSHSPNIVLAFRITSQDHYTRSYLSRELVSIPVGTHSCLRKQSWIQCFHEFERLDIGELQSGWKANRVSTVGRIASLLAEVCAVIELSDVLSPQDIADGLAVLRKVT